MYRQSSISSTGDNYNYSFYLDPEKQIADAAKNLEHPFILSVVSVLGEVMTSSDLDKLNYYAILLWDKFYDSDEFRVKMNEIQGGEQLLHILMNMKYFVQTLKHTDSKMEKRTLPEDETHSEQHIAKRFRND
jgi:hypothetical protein